MIHTPVLWKNISRPIDFCLVSDDFGVKYVGKRNARHLIDILKEDFTISEDWKIVLYYKINLKLDYDKRTLYISILWYIKNKYKSKNICTPVNLSFPPNLLLLVNMG